MQSVSYLLADGHANFSSDMPDILLTRNCLQFREVLYMHWDIIFQCVQPPAYCRIVHHASTRDRFIHTADNADRLCRPHCNIFYVHRHNFILDSMENLIDEVCHSTVGLHLKTIHKAVLRHCIRDDTAFFMRAGSFPNQYTFMFGNYAID